MKYSITIVAFTALFSLIYINTSLADAMLKFKEPAKTKILDSSFVIEVADSLEDDLARTTAPRVISGWAHSNPHQIDYFKYRLKQYKSYTVYIIYPIQATSCSPVAMLSKMEYPAKFFRPFGRSDVNAYRFTVEDGLFNEPPLLRLGINNESDAIVPFYYSVYEL
ncbi:MAG: hypothetical protein SGJ04_01015 [Bacteroidota bacterium]|nr:hypothetical protein [Bacteroidota bacterium]